MDTDSDPPDDPPSTPETPPRLARWAETAKGVRAEYRSSYDRCGEICLAVHRRLVWDDEYSGRIIGGRVVDPGGSWDSGDRHCWIAVRAPCGPSAPRDAFDSATYYIDPALDQFNAEYRESDVTEHVSVSFGATTMDVPSVAMVGPDHEWRARYLRR